MATNLKKRPGRVEGLVLEPRKQKLCRRDKRKEALTKKEWDRLREVLP
jgi:hypothetical protein